MTAPLSPFAEAAPRLLEWGYSPLPILPPTASHHKGAGKAPGSFSGGVWGGRTGWQKLAQQPLSGFELTLAMMAPDSGVGVVLGTPAGADADGEPLFLIALDFDVDGDDLDALLRAAPSTPMAKAGRVGLTRFYRAPSSIKSRAYDRRGDDGKVRRVMDLLASGRQTVVPGSLHVAGMPYRWIGEAVPAEELPIFTPDDLAALEETLEMVGWEREASAATDARPGVIREPGNYENEWAEANGEGIARLDDWFPALNLPGTRRTRKGWEAVPVWRESNTGRPAEQRKRNLSASHGGAGVPAGIRDFGASAPDDRLTAIDLVQRALDLDAGEALEWLRERLGLGDDGGVVIDLQPRPERQTPPAKLEKTEGVDGARVIGGPETNAGSGCDSHIDAPTHGVGELPTHLLEVPGLVGQVANWIVARSRKPQPVLALAAALCVVGTAAGRRYAGPTHSGTHAFCLLIGRSGTGKDAPMEAAVQILRAAGLGRAVGPGSFMSESAWYQVLARAPRFLSCIDEFGSFMQKMNSKGASSHESMISGAMRTTWGRSFAEMAPPEWAQRSLETIFAPAASIIGASTPEEFFKALQGGDLVNGFLNRFLLFATDARPASRPPTVDPFTVPAGIIEAIKRIDQAAGVNPVQLATLHNDRVDAPLIVARFLDSQVGAAHEAFAEAMDLRETDAAFYARTGEYAVRLATIRAIGRDPEKPLIDMDDLRWAQQLAIWSAERMRVDAAEYMAENATDMNRKRVLRLIAAHQPIAHGALLRKLPGLKAREVKEIVDVLKDADEITVELGEAPAGGGHRIKTYRIKGRP